MTPADSVDDRPSQRIPLLFGLLLIVGLLLAKLPYRGVRHDAVLYLGQALTHLDPTWAAKDYYFAFGSQDRYSVFSPILAHLIHAFGTAPAEIGLLLGSWVVYLFALYQLGAGLASRERWLGMAAVICASHYYGSNRTFSFLEAFLTARTWAEPLSLLALAFLLRGRLPLALLSLAAAVACHPLLAVPMAAVGFAFLLGKDRRWAWLLLGLGPILALGYAGVPPFSSLMQCYDDPWFHVVMIANAAVFESDWSRTDIVSAISALVMLWLFFRADRSPLARACRATFWTSLALCAVSFVGVDAVHNILLTQLQLWRVLWIADLLALLVLPSVFAREWAKGPQGRLAATAVLVAFFTIDTSIATGWAIGLWAFLTLILSTHRVEVKSSVLRLASVATWIVGLALTGLQVFNAQGQLSMQQQGMAIARVTSIPFTLPLLMLPLAFGLMWGWRRGGAMRVGAATVATALLAYAAAQWDQRTAWAKYIESATQGQHPFDALIPPGSQVYWHDDTLATWAVLGRPQFVSDFQMSGLLFNRGTAMTGISRLPALHAVRAKDSTCSTLEWYGVDPALVLECQLPREPFYDLCRTKPEHSDFLIASTDFGDGVVARWRFVPPDGSRPVTYALYDCSKLR